jgi:hypothetical protein
MILTEEEAKAKRCQEGFPGNAVADGKYRDGAASTHWTTRSGDEGGAFTSPTYCLGSGCMAWRWTTRDGQTKTDNGYCGKAGRPEHVEP